jgi:hypothetical protein
MRGTGETIKNKTIIDYASQATNVAIPAILRLTPAEPEAKNANCIKIQIQPTTMTGEAAALSSLQATVSAERAAYLQMIQPASHVDVLLPAHVRAEHELMSQIPRLKETLAALDSEMHASVSSDVEKRLLVHERIMQLQGAQLTRVQHAVEQTVQSMSNLMDQHAQQDVQQKGMRAQTALHEKLHKASMQSLVGVKNDTQALRKTSALHTELLKASGEGVLGLRQETQALRKTSALHTELHKASGEGVLGLRDETEALQKTSALHTELHQASGEGVLRLREEARALRTTSELHTQLHQAGGAGVLGLHAQASKLQKTSDLHTQLHMASGKCLSTLQAGGSGTCGASGSGASGVSAGVFGVSAGVSAAESCGAFCDESVDEDAGEEMRQMRADLDELASENKRLKASVALHDELHRATSAIVSTLHKQTLEAHDEEATCHCGHCNACQHRRTHTGTSANTESGSEAHARILSMLQTDIASSNKPRQKRGI